MNHVVLKQLIPARLMSIVLCTLWWLLAVVALINVAHAWQFCPLNIVVVGCIVLHAFSALNELMSWQFLHTLGRSPLFAQVVLGILRTAFVFLSLNAHMHPFDNSHVVASHMCRVTGSTLGVVMLIAVGWGIINDEVPRRRVEIAVSVVVVMVLRGLDLVFGMWFAVGLAVLQMAAMFVVILQTTETIHVLTEQCTECAAEIAADEGFAAFGRRNSALVRGAKVYRGAAIPFFAAHVVASLVSGLLRVRWVAMLLRCSANWLCFVALLSVLCVRRDMRRTPFFTAYHTLFTHPSPLPLESATS